MYKRLGNLGITVAITRDTERTLTREKRINTMVNSFGNEEDLLVLSNHINAGGEKDYCSKITFFEKNIELLY